MKVKVLCRNPDDYMRETKKDIHKVNRNLNPTLHPFESAREYVQALNTVKLERVFAKPFVGALDGHRDSIQCLAKHPKKLSYLVSGGCDGEIRLWDLMKRTCARVVPAHNGIVRGICFPRTGDSFFSIGDDKTIKQWKSDVNETENEPINTVVTKTMLTGISHHWKRPLYATCGEQVDIWDESRSVPLKSFTWEADSHCSIKFNPVETDLLVICASDRCINLYDTREAHPLRKIIMKLRSNAVAWNPMESFIFTAANEDYNLYTFDIRHLKRPLNVHMDHISAVVDVDYSPTGREFVSGSYDKTIRIFPVDKGHSREIYHTKRMQRLTSVVWSLDNKFVLSASDEMNIRIWKARASEKLGVLRPREKAAFNYGEKLKDTFGSHPEIRRIAHHRHVPKHVYNGRNELRLMRDSQKRKEMNRRLHSKPGSVPYVAERDKHVMSEKQ